MSTWQEQISDPAGLGIDHGEGEDAALRCAPCTLGNHTGTNGTPGCEGDCACPCEGGNAEALHAALHDGWVR